MLSDNEIVELIYKETYGFLSTANYSTLRQHCLDQKALSVVIDQIQVFVDQIAQHEKEKNYSRQFAKACTQQQQQDIDENKCDMEEALNDEIQYSALNIERTQLSEQQMCLQQAINNREETIQRLAISINLPPRPNNQLVQARTRPRVHIHNEHGHSRPNTPQTHDHQDAITESLHYVTQEQNELILQKELRIAEQKKLLNKLEVDRAVVQKQTQRQLEINHILNRTLPERRQQREERASERAMRKQARLENAPLPLEQQLSARNYSLLCEYIQKKNERIEAQGHQIVTRAQALCFQLYINCLIKYLADKENLKDKTLLSFNEIKALQQIAEYMQQSLKITSEEDSKNSATKKNCNTKASLGDQLTDEENKLNTLQRANPVLTNQNIRLTDENEQLAQTIKERLDYRNKLLQIGAVILLLTLGTALPTFFMGLTLVFFTPSVLLALVTTGLFIASLIYTARNNSDKHLLAQNQLTIGTNAEKISSQSKQIDTLEHEMLPSLKKQISNIKKEIEEHRKEIKELQIRKQLYIDKAGLVRPNSILETVTFYTHNVFIPSQQQPQNMDDAPQYESTTPRF